jgi:uncharacterized membrane protein YkvA (DUF1232 family)
MGKLAVGYLTALAVSLLAVWLVVALVILIKRPDRAHIAAALRLPREVLHLTANLLRDETLPRGVRVRLWLLAAYLASPVDLIPDILPLIGYCDDIVVTALVLRSTFHRVGYERFAAAWDGDAEGFAAITRLCGLHAERSPKPAAEALLLRPR